MSAEVYTFKVVYENCDNKIYRVFEVSSNYTLAQLGYVILASFRTNAYHLFSIEYKGTVYETDIEYDGASPLMREVKLSSMSLQCGEHLKMIYDFGCEQEFDIVLTDIQPMPKHRGRAYPRVIEGEGLGIIDDMPADELLNIINKTDCDGKSDFKITTEFGNDIIWDYRDYRIDDDNCLLKGSIEQIQRGYEQDED